MDNVACGPIEIQDIQEKIQNIQEKIQDIQVLSRYKY